jgi:hypothetical protein
MATPAKKPKKRLVSMDTEEVSIVNAGANGHTQWLIVKGADGKEVAQGIPVETASEEVQKQALDARSEKYGIEKMSQGGRLTVGNGLPAAEALYGDPVNLRYPIGDGDNQYSEETLKSSLDQFRKDHHDYKTDMAKSRIFERLVRKGLAKGITFANDPEDTLNKLLPADLKVRLSKQNTDDPLSQNEQTPKVEPSAEPRTKSGQGADLVTELGSTMEEGKRAIAISKSTTDVRRLRTEVDSVLKKAAESNTEPGPSSNQSDEVGNDGVPEPNVDELKKSTKEKDKQIEFLTKQLNKVRAEKSRRSTAIGTSQALRPRETRKTAEGPDTDGSSAQDYIDMSPPLEKA